MSPHAGLQALSDTVLLERLRPLPRESIEREAILMLRFYGNLTQDQIGARLGISQMHVCRLLDKALSYLRARITQSA